MGGASQGATEAGCDVVLAVDSWGEALRVHKLNHAKGTMHVCTTLPSKLPLPFPARGTRWHCHGSSPCTTVSTAQYAQEPGEEDIATAVGLIVWYVELAIDSALRRGRWNKSGRRPCARPSTRCARSIAPALITRCLTLRASACRSTAAA